MEFQIRKMTPEDKPQVLEFLRNNFGSESVQCRPNRFEWQFERYPGGAQIYLCFHDEKLVAQSCFLPQILQVRNEQLTAAFSMDTMVAPEYRRKGIGEKFYQQKRENFQVGLSSGQTESAANLYKKMGWSILGSYFQFKLVKRFPRPQKAKLFAKDIVGYFRYKSRLNKFNKKPRVIISSNYSKEVLKQLDRGLESEIFPKVSGEYLSWRYSEHPFYRYQYIQVFDDHQYLGTCVARITKPGIYRLVDFYCPRENFYGLLEGIARSLDCYGIEGRMVGAPLKKYFIDTGFSAIDTYQHILGSSNHKGVMDKISKCNWLVFGGDSDNDR